VVNIWLALAAVGFALVARVIAAARRGAVGRGLWQDVRQSVFRALLYVNVLGMSLALQHWYPAADGLVHFLVVGVVAVEFSAGLSLSGVAVPTDLLPWDRTDQQQPPKEPPHGQA